MVLFFIIVKKKIKKIKIHLESKRNLSIREDRTKGIYIADLTEVYV